MTQNLIYNKVYIDDSVAEELMQRFIALDIETTGLEPSADRIIEIGAVLFEQGKIKNRYCSLINTGRMVSPSAMAVNHISNEILQYATGEERVYAELTEFLDDALQEGTILVAHNASFDLAFLAVTLERMGYKGKLRYADTLAFSRKMLKNVVDHKQTTIAQYLNLETGQAHRAGTDAELCGKIMVELLNRYQKNKSDSCPILPEKKMEITAVEIHPVHNRVPVDQIRNTVNKSKNSHKAYQYWEDGEVLREQGRMQEAIACFDKAREQGYLDALLYESYASAFHVLGDYDNEVAILEEGIDRLVKIGKKTGRLESRKNKVVQLLVDSKLVS